MQRSGEAKPVQALVVPLTADPNVALRAAAGGRRTAFIWLYDTANQSDARDHPSTFESDPAGTCHRSTRQNNRLDELGSIACIRLGDGDD